MTPLGGYLDDSELDGKQGRAGMTGNRATWMTRRGLVTHGKVVKSEKYELVDQFRKMSSEEIKHITQSAQNYIMLMKEYKS
ncbi:LbetaH domain-containing protein [Wolbachia endosymbiont of Atemnus politus]|uniref:hypothetical protein n=1 Tax=Wolbachia endosymbiont of Atemnus politus TaxID=2682840 RepID=UPI001FEC7639|nr:hypothetical protein [Wolbachia endosymbiont of Atemnus politus]